MKKQHDFINQGFDAWDTILQKYQPKKTLLVCGQASYQSVKNTVESLLNQLTGEIIIFNDFGKKPCIEDIFRGVQLCQKEHIDLIIAVGGGHCIDTAKAINILSQQSSALNQSDDLALYIQGKEKVQPVTRPLIVMPTTCGSGSEATHFAVVYIDSDKYSLAHPSILPDWVIADKSLLSNLPKPIAIYTALDALCQAIESYWSVGANAESEENAIASLNIISPHLKNRFKVDDPFLMDMVCAANHSGKAINISKTTAPHALSYYLTDQFDVPHGIAVALTLGEIASYTQQHGNPQTQEKIKHIKTILNFADDFAQSWYQFLSNLGFSCQLSDYGLTKEHLPQMVASVNLQRLANHPVNFDAPQLQVVLEQRY